MMRYLVFAGFLMVSMLVKAQDAQWRGPDRNGIYTGTGLLKSWPEDGPEVLFVTEGIGKGYSSAVATEKMIYATGLRDTIEYLTAMDLKGNVLWQNSFGPGWNQSFPESRCTPAVQSDRVWVLSGLDNLVCFDALSGKEIWSVDIHQAYGSKWDLFGVSESLLLVDDKVIVTPAGENTTVIALDKMTGELVWKSESMGTLRSNMSPSLIDHCGRDYIITANRTHMISVDAESGEIMWSYHYNILDENNENTTIFTNTPTYSDSCLWITSGWDKESVMLEISPDGRSVTEKFIDHTFDNQNHGVVLLDGYLYGSNFTGQHSGKWVCMNWDTGEITWIEPWFTKGPVISAEGMLYCYDEKRGNMALVKADPDEFEVISTYKVKDGKGPHWARPAIFNQMLLVRHGDVLVSYKLGS
ncbi:MAG: PQQ-binding-like beta-propeller repeat protein [Bacteroidetes bacterium]|nr:PQQ-binding-like beta-propeller repeat protein [Bacteroidota bacterium]